MLLYCREIGGGGGGGGGMSEANGWMLEKPDESAKGREDHPSLPLQTRQPLNREWCEITVSLNAECAMLGSNN